MHSLKNLPLLILLFLVHTSYAQDLSKYVDPMTGTGGVGHTYPGATLPHGMVQLSPDTRRDGSWEGCAGYYYADTLIYGFTHTHLSGTGCSDYGDILLMPGQGRRILQSQLVKNPGDADQFSRQRSNHQKGATICQL